MPQDTFELTSLKKLNEGEEDEDLEEGGPRSNYSEDDEAEDDSRLLHSTKGETTKGRKGKPRRPEEPTQERGKREAEEAEREGEEEVDEEVEGEGVREEGKQYSARFLRWRRLVLSGLCVGYVGYYFCRSHLDVLMPSFAEAQNLSKEDLGIIVAVGYATNILGRLLMSLVIDFFGGRKVFLIGMAGSIAANVAFTFCETLPQFATTWGINYFVYSVGWGCVVKILTTWSSEDEYSKLFGMTAGVSYMFGDAFVRLTIGLISLSGVGWRTLFHISSGIVGFILVFSALSIKESPVDVKEKMPRAGGNSVFGQKGEENIATGPIMDLVRPLFRSPKFWVLMFQKSAMTFIRATFLTWTPLFLVDRGMTYSQAAMASLLFPFFGGIASTVSGKQLNNISKRMRGAVPLAYLVVVTISQVALYLFTKYFDGEPLVDYAVLLTMVSFIAYCFQPPQSFCDGLFSLEVAGKRGIGLMVNMLNAGGSVGGMLSGYLSGWVAANYGWPSVFLLLLLVCILTTLSSVIFWALDVRTPNKASPSFMPRCCGAS